VEQSIRCRRGVSTLDCKLTFPTNQSKCKISSIGLRAKKRNDQIFEGSPFSMGALEFPFEFELMSMLMPPIQRIRGIGYGSSLM
jgi:hypothetical protein